MMEEIDEFQEQLQISLSKDEDNEYSLVNSSFTTKEEDNENSSLTDHILKTDDDDNDVSLLEVINRFRCSYLGCDQNFFDEECDECQQLGRHSQCFCVLHKNHLDHYIAVKDKKENKDIEIEDNDVTLLNGNANQLYIYNLLKCVTEVRVLLIIIQILEK